MEDHEEGAIENDVPDTSNSTSPSFIQSDEVLEERQEIRAYRNYGGTGYWCSLEFFSEFTADGSQFKCRTSRYNAKDNGEKKGNLYVRASSQNTWDRTWNDIGNQNGQWNPLEATGSVNSPNGSATVYFKYIYDRSGVEDVEMEVDIVLTFKPATPVITSPSGDVTTNPFTVTGTGGIPNAGTITLHNANGGAQLATAVIATDGSWTASATFPPGLTTLTFYAKQTIRNSVSGESNRVTVNLVVTAVTIDSPKSGDSLRERQPMINGKGHSGATIKVYEADSGVILYGSGTAQGGQWSIRLTTPLPIGPFTFHASQEYAGQTTWSDKVPVSVLPKLPVITQPAAQSVQNRSFTVSGIEGEVGAIMRILLDLNDTVVGTLQSVTGNAWSVLVDIPASIPPGEVRLAAQQTLRVPSDRSDSRPFKLKPSQPGKLTVQVDAQGKVTLGGTGHIGATFYLHVVNNGMPFHSFTVATSPWTVFFPDWLPGTSLVNGRQSVPDGAGQPIYSDWISEDTTVEVPVPPPTLSSRVNPDGIPTFYGTGRNWSDQPASRVEVRLEGASSAIVPIVDVRADTTWSSTATERWAPGTYQVTAIQWFTTLQSGRVQPPVSVIISAPPAVIEKVTPNGVFAEVVGQCWPGAELTITFSDNPASHPLEDADKNGQWDFQRSTPFRPGRHTVTVTQTFGGQTSNPVSMSFDIAVSVPVITPPPGGETDHLPVLHGTGGFDGFTIRVFDFVTHQLLGETIATGDEWSVALTELDYGPHAVFAIQVLGDLESPPSNTVAFKVVLLAPTIDLPETGASVPRTFTVKGYARAGKGFDRTEVDVYLDGDPFRVYPLFGDGYFEQNFTRPLGPCVLNARQYFKDQESPHSQDVLITIVPGKALIETPGIGEAVGKTAPICGFGFPADDVVVALPDFTELGRTKVQNDGTWLCPVELPETGTDLSLITEQRNGEFRSGWSEPRSVQRLMAPPTFDEPLEGKWEEATPGFAGGAFEGSQVDVVAWYDSDEKHAEALVTNGGRWAGASERNLPAGPQWARAVQVVGGKRSMPADSKRFEVVPPDEPPGLA
ncbi:MULTISPECIES: hypothetical protein [Pseudomonas]|uniref:Ig-like domain repeat protein n=1 Tax=Pseudomonas aphyarum TaxID=2942629 RepID=A0ABT5PIX9_9PSED|nr:hypothetical protein [Pseudomonas aphyarum]MDD0970772.1 hypothetical protein [Pseudomonas aphyarum]MDD1123828.1 hypothetical protein [Pseudomonas aphyarum]